MRKEEESGGGGGGDEGRRRMMSRGSGRSGWRTGVGLCAKDDESTGDEWSLVVQSDGCDGGGGSGVECDRRASPDASNGEGGGGGLMMKGAGTSDSR